jgi:hypothetical protein
MLSSVLGTWFVPQMGDAICSQIIALCNIPEGNRYPCRIPARWRNVAIRIELLTPN